MAIVLIGTILETCLYEKANYNKAEFCRKIGKDIPDCNLEDLINTAAKMGWLNHQNSTEGNKEEAKIVKNYRNLIHPRNYSGDTRIIPSESDVEKSMVYTIQLLESIFR